jgi:NADH-quinone oxidoreductase subunit E
MEQIADLLDISTTDVASLVGFYTLYHDKPEGAYRLQVCADLPCALRGAEQFLASVCDNLGIRAGETTPDGKITLESVMCLAACDKAPMFQLQSPDGISYHENQTLESTLALIEGLPVKKQEAAPAA